MDLWPVLLDILVLLASAMVLGAICERLRQSPLIGYLAAGTILGPHALGVIHGGAEVDLLAELGVALLLFSIGLEFSWVRLRRLGRTALLGGVLQIVVTLLLGSLAAWAMGVSLRAAPAIGAIIALSSTACVLRLLVSRAEMESVHGNHALGVLLVQDAAVVPLVLMVSIFAGEGGASEAVMAAIPKLVGAVVLIVVLYALFTWVVPMVLHFESVRRNRDLPALLAITSGLGSAWGAHAVGLSPALGAFVAGMLLAASPFATQIRADVASMRALLVTLFFSSIGMLGDPGWLLAHLGPVLLAVGAIVLGKAIVIWIVLRALGLASTNALATGICLAQVGEFSFVLAIAGRGTLIDENLFNLLVSATITTLFLTPLLVGRALWGADLIVRRFTSGGRGSPAPENGSESPGPRRGHVIVIGFGPAGEIVATSLQSDAPDVLVIDLNPRLLAAARRQGFETHIGDALHADVLEHANVQEAEAVVVTIPDPAGARAVVSLVRSLAPDTHVIARGRYHRHVVDLVESGAHEVADEEKLMGRRLVAHVRRRLQARPVPDPDDAGTDSHST